MLTFSVGRDCLAIMPTGSGKSLLYHLPALLWSGVTIVVTPLLALMACSSFDIYGSIVFVKWLICGDTQENQASSLAKNKIPSVQINGNSSSVDLDGAVTSAIAGIVKIFFVTPEFLSARRGSSFLASLHGRGKVSAIAVDEAHCISSWGNDFRPKYRTLSTIRQTLPGVPIIAVTASATRAVERDIYRSLMMQDPFVLRTSFNRPEVFYAVLPKRSDYVEQIVEYVSSKFDLQTECGIVYCRTKTECGNFAEMFGKHISRPYTAGMAIDERNQVASAFMAGKIRVVCATVAFGMGFDKQDVRFVIHASVPPSMEAFYQESGRAGRDGQTSSSVIFYDEKDLETIAFLSNQDKRKKYEQMLADITEESDVAPKTQKNVEQWLETQAEIALEGFRSVREFCSGVSCRRQILLKYFNDQKPSAVPKMSCCDVCADSCTKKRPAPEEHENDPYLDCEEMCVPSTAVKRPTTTTVTFQSAKQRLSSQPFKPPRRTVPQDGSIRSFFSNE